MKEVSTKIAGAPSSRRIRARISYKGINYEKTVRTREAEKKWRAQMLLDLERCPVEVTLSRNTWIATLETPQGDVTKKFTTLEPAIQWVSKVKSDIVHGVYLNDEEANLTLEAYIALWRKAKHRATGRTMQSYNLLIKNQILPYLGDAKLRAISPTVVRTWVGELVGEEVGAPTINKAYALLRQVMKMAFEDELIRRNPVANIELPTVTPKEQKALTLPELLELSEECPDHKAMILVMGLMGLRIGETCGLQIRDVNLLKSEMVVRQAMTHGLDYRRFVDSTKTKQVRAIPIPEPLIPFLKELMDNQKPTAPLFRGVKGGAINDGWFRKAVMGPAVSSLGWENVSLHTLRHTCASLLISAGTPITAVSRILGHSSVLQTLNTYGHFYKEDVKASMQQIGQAFVSARGLDGDFPRELLA